MRLGVQFTAELAVLVKCMTAVHYVFGRRRSLWVPMVEAGVELLLQELVQGKLRPLLRSTSSWSRASLRLLAHHIIIELGGHLQPLEPSKAEAGLPRVLDVIALYGLQSVLTVSLVAFYRLQ